jgi:CubicO group peptidase (beta-lactamase class C family)
MSDFEFVSIILSIVVGLGITRILAGLAATIRYRATLGEKGLSALWASTVLFWQILFWLATVNSYRTSGVGFTVVNFGTLLLLAVALFFASALILPDRIRPTTDLSQHFWTVRRPFFLVMAAVPMLELTDSAPSNCPLFKASERENPEAFMTWRRSLAFAALSIATLLQAPVSGQVSLAEKIAVMDSIAESPVAEGRVAGLAVVVVQGADTLLMKAYGEADLEWDVPMTVDAVFEIGSVTKQFTAAAILKLRDEGKLDLDADLTEYLPDYPTHGRRIPVRRLLDHTSGIQGVTEMPEFRALRGQDLPRDSLLSLFGNAPFLFEPGEALIYNNSAFILLGHIIEKVSGVTYEEYVEEQLFDELGMSRSSYCSNSEVVEGRAHGYQLTPSGLVRRSYTSHVWPFSAGSLCSTIGDLALWLDALHGGQVLPEESYREMITPAPLKDGTPTRYAMGLSVAPDVGGRPVISHGGGIAGFVSDTRYYPEEDLTLVTLVNTNGNLSPAALSQEMVDVLLPRVPREIRPFSGDARSLIGSYSGASRGGQMTIRVSLDDGRLVAGPNPSQAQPLAWSEGWTFYLGPVQIVTFERDGDEGPATVMRIDGGGSHYVLRR